MAQEKIRALTTSTPDQLSREQIDLIKNTVAIGTTDLELKLFLYTAQKRGLDPLARQIYFIKRKRFNPDTEKTEEAGTIQTGIDGFRVIADRTGKLVGISRGVLKDNNGNLIGAWAEVYRSDWTHPAREEVSFKEYCQTKKDGSPVRLWATMPETMIKKVAEAAALRMAFPEDLSGIYTHDEMQQADSVELVKDNGLVGSKLPTPAEEMTEGTVSDVVKWALQGRRTVDKSSHYCSVHDVNFFKKGRMRDYAHPIEGTDPPEWCQEVKPIHTVQQIAKEMAEATTSTLEKLPPGASQEKSGIITKEKQEGISKSWGFLESLKEFGLTTDDLKDYPDVLTKFNKKDYQGAYDLLVKLTKEKGEQ